jgi:hypothetical protein
MFARSGESFQSSVFEVARQHRPLGDEMANVHPPQRELSVGLRHARLKR